MKTKNCLIAGVFALPLFFMSCNQRDNQITDAPAIPKDNYVTPEKRANDSANLSLLSKVNMDLIAVLTVINSRTSDMDAKNLTTSLLKNHTEFQTGLKNNAMAKGIMLADPALTEAKDRVNQLDTVHHEEFDANSVAELKNRYSYMLETVKDAQDRIEDADFKNFIATELAFMESNKEHIAALK